MPSRPPRPPVAVLALRATIAVAFPSLQPCGDKHQECLNWAFAGECERNMAFMRDQHRQMLAALQEEVDTLKRRNQGGNYNRRMSKNSTGWSIWCRKNFCWHGIMSFVIKLGRII